MYKAFEKIIEKLEELHERYINQYGAVGGNPMAFSVKECMEIVKQEAEQYNNGWISCSERFPEKPRENPKLEGRYVELYLVVEKESDYPFRAFWNGKSFTDGMFPLDVIAWQPLPKPFQTKGK